MQMSEHFKFIFEGKYYFQEQRKYGCNMLKLYNEKNMVPFTNVLISVMDAEPKLQKNSTILLYNNYYQVRRMPSGIKV